MEVIREGKNKKRGRRLKNEKKEYVVNRDQTKFFVDLSSDKKQLDMVFDLLLRVNGKDYGREILFKDLALFGLSKLVDKDIEKIQETSLGEMEKVQRALDDFNLKNKESLSLGEFLVKKLNIN